MLDATEENDFENAIEVFLKGAEMIVEAEDLQRSSKECILGEFQQGKIGFW